jgi:hypothetical protein
MSMMPPDGVRRIDGRLIHQSAWKVHSRNFPVRGSPKFARNVSKITHWGCTAPCAVVALSAAAPRRSGRNGVQEMHLLQVEHRISVEQVAQTLMEEHL